jgi:hypothetical protein
MTRVDPTNSAGQKLPPTVPFFQRRWVLQRLPVATSITFHLALFIIAAMVLPPLVHAIKDVSKEQISIPDTMMAEDGKIGGIPNPGLGKDPTRSASQENDSSVTDSHNWAQRKNDSLVQALKDSSAASVGDAKSSARDISALPFASQGGDQLSTFGPRGGGQGIGPRSKIFGHGSNMRSIIYICDASGSMVGQGEDVLRAELKKAIANLSPVQQFNVLFFHEGDAGAYQEISDGLLMGTPHNKAAAFDFVDNLVFAKANNPIAALEEAFRQRPQLIFLLSHGDFNNQYNTTNNAEVLDKIRQLNSEKTVHINTILLLGDKDKQVAERKSFEEMMQKIAQENGGVYNKYYSDDL